jgi:putative acetyltransferase
MSPGGVEIREELPRDRAAVRAVNEAAFGQAAEANLVESIHDAAAVIASLVAVAGGVIVGHILFSPVDVERTGGRRLAGLAPMAVAPAYQKQGLGSRLVRDGLARCAEAGYDGVVVVGHPSYYPRFGFAPAVRAGLSCEYDVPPEAFMSVALPGRSLEGVSGLVRYHPAFQAV